MEKSEAGRHVQRQRDDAVLDLDVLRMQHIGRTERIPELRAKLVKRSVVVADNGDTVADKKTEVNGDEAVDSSDGDE